MGHYSECRFCKIIKGKYQYNEIDRPFLNDGEFVAVASIGALVEGWSLIIPKEHQLSMRNAYNKADFKDFVSHAISLLNRFYGPLIAFEHGSNNEGSNTACGTDHAHLHLLPFEGSLLLDLQNSNLQWDKCLTSEIPDRVEEMEYHFYSELESKKSWQDPVGYLHILERPISQFFRHLIAKQVGCSEASDYRQFPFLETARQTYKVLAR